MGDRRTQLGWGLLRWDEPSTQQAAPGLFYPLRFSCVVRKSPGGRRGGGDVASVPCPVPAPHGGDAAADAAVTPLLHGPAGFGFSPAGSLPSASSRRANGPKRSVGRIKGALGWPPMPWLWGPIVCVPCERCWPHHGSPAGVFLGEPPGKLLLGAGPITGP